MFVGNPVSHRSLGRASSPVYLESENFFHKGWTAIAGALNGTLEYVQKKTGFAAADFAKNLAEENFQRVFAGTKYADLESYEKALDAYREDSRVNSSSTFPTIAKKMFYQPIWDLAYETLEPYFLDRAITKDVENFADKFVKDTEVIKESLRAAIGQGSIYNMALKLTAYTSLFDSHRNGNYPYLAGTRFINQHKVGVLRHGVPIREWLEPSAILPKSNSGDDIEAEGKEPKNLGNSCVSEEYKAFLDYCILHDKKILYNCLLNPYNKERDERPRIEALFKLGLEEKYKDTFHFIRIPADGPIIKGCRDPSNLLAYSNLICENIEGLRTWSNADFQSWEALSKKDLKGFIPGSSKIRDIILNHYGPLLQFAYSVILHAYDSNRQQDLGGAELTHLLQEKKQAFMMLFCTLLKMCLIKELGITDYNNTCKDAIDRGSMHLVCDFLWDSFLTNDLKRSQDNLRVHAAWPAIMAKTQAILHDRAEWITSFARWIERVEANRNLKISIFDFCRKNGLAPDRPVDFLNIYKSRRYISQAVSKNEGNFEVSQKLILPICFDARNLVNDQGPLKEFILKGIPFFLEKWKYHNLPLELSQESVLDITSTSQDENAIFGELGIFSPNFHDFVGGPVFTISAEDQKIGQLEVALKWKIKKEDLDKKPIPIELSIQSRLVPLEEVFEVISDEGDLYEHRPISDEAQVEERRRKRAETIESKQIARHPPRMEPVFLDPLHRLVVDEAPRGDVLPPTDRSNYRLIRSSSADSLLTFKKNPLHRSSWTRENLLPIDNESNPANETLIPPIEFEEFPSVQENAEVVVPKKTQSRRYRMGRDIAFLSAGAIMGSAISLWSRSFFGLSKSNLAENNKEPLITEKTSEGFIVPNHPKISQEVFETRYNASPANSNSQLTVLDFSHPEILDQASFDTTSRLEKSSEVNRTNIVVTDDTNSRLMAEGLLPPPDSIKVDIFPSNNVSFTQSVIPNSNIAKPFSGNLDDFLTVEPKINSIFASPILHKENAKIAEDVDHVATTVLSDPSAFSTSFKIVSSVILGVAVAYTGLKIYQYFYSQSHKPVKKDIPVIIYKAPEEISPLLKITFLKKIVARAQSIGKSVSNFYFRKELAK